MTEKNPHMPELLDAPERAERPGDPLEEKTIESKRLFDSDFLKLDCETVLLPGGEVSKRYMLPHCGAAGMVVLDEDGTVVLERQWRHPCKQAFWEIPAGKIDEREEPITCARRELVEECGIHAERWNRLGTIRNAIGYSNERIVIYLAQGLTYGERHLDPGEYLEVRRVPLETALRMCDEGLITDCKTLVGLYWLDRYLKGEKKTEP